VEGAQQSQKAAQDLNDLAARLKQVVAQYRAQQGIEGVA